MRLGPRTNPRTNPRTRVAIRRRSMPPEQAILTPTDPAARPPVRDRVPATSRRVGLSVGVAHLPSMASGALTERLATTTRPVVPRPPTPRLVPQPRGQRWRLLETQVDHHREPTRQRAYIPQHRRSRLGPCDLRANPPDTLGVRQQHALAPRPTTPRPRDGLPPRVTPGTIPIQLGSPPQLHPRRHRIDHD